MDDPTPDEWEPIEAGMARLADHDPARQAERDAALEALRAAMRYEIVALRRFGVLVTPWQARRIRWWRRFGCQRRAQRLIIKALR